MSTCSTATSAHRGNESRLRRRPPSSDAIRGHLEMRLQDLKRDWDAYKTGRSGSGAPRHRRSRSASDMPSSAVTTVVEAPGDGFLLPLLPCSPRRLVSSLQQAGAGSADLDALTGHPLTYDEDSSSVCSVEACSCPSQCADVLCCGCSTSSSCTGTTVSSFASAAGGINGGRARKMGDGKWVAIRVVVWISAIALVVVGFVVAMIIVELGVDDEGLMEYQVPT